MLTDMSPQQGMTTVHVPYQYRVPASRYMYGALYYWVQYMYLMVYQLIDTVHVYQAYPPGPEAGTYRYLGTVLLDGD